MALDVSKIEGLDGILNSLASQNEDLARQLQKLSRTFQCRRCGRTVPESGRGDHEGLHKATGAIADTAARFPVNTLADVKERHVHLEHMMGAAKELTVASSAIRRRGMFHKLAGGGNLDKIAGGRNGMLLYLRASSDSVDQTIRHNQDSGTGNNILTSDNASVVLNEEDKILVLIYDGSLDTKGAWIEFGRSAGLIAHAGLVGITATDHHTKYTDADAIAAVEGEATLDLAGNVKIADGKGIIVGHTAAIGTEGSSTTQILGNATLGTDTSIVIGRWGATNASPAVAFVKSQHADVGSNTIVNDNDSIGALRFYPADGVDFETLVGEIKMEVDDASPAAGDIGAAFVLRQKPGGGGAIGETFRIPADGTIRFLGTGSGTILFIRERAAAASNEAELGQVWVKSDGPNELWFTDDAGTDFHISAAANRTPAFTIEDPTSSENVCIGFTFVAITVQELQAVVVGSSTPSCTINPWHAPSRNATGGSRLRILDSATAITNEAGGQNLTAFTDATIPADSWIVLETTAKSGTVDEMTISFRYTVD